MTDASLSKTILLVEENKDFNTAMSRVLKNAGYFVKSAHRPEDAVKYTTENDDVNLILMNIDSSSGMDGTEAARIILASKTLPVIFIVSVIDNQIMDKIRGITRYGIYIKSSGEHLLLSSLEMSFELFEIDKKRCEILTEETDYKKSEKIIEARLRLVEYSLNHSLDEVLQKTLDEVTEISESPIGFYHFVGDDEKTLHLQGWSTRTMKEFCTAAGKGSHYGVEQAGVWGDAVRERRPVIHNDYASLPNRKGLPHGHAPVIREVVVPIFRNDKIVAILGVGNKHSDYTDNDIQIVSFFADVAWEIAGKKRSEEALAERERNYRLMFDTANEAIIIAQDGVIKFMNSKTIELFGGYTAEEITDRPFINFIHPDDRNRVVNNYIKRISGEHAETRYPFRAVVFGGVVKWVEVNSVLTEWNGKPATMNFYTDITDQKRVEDELIKSEIFAHATLDALSTNIAILNENGIIIAVNRAWREFALNNAMDISASCEGINYLGVCDSSDGANSDEAEQASSGIREIISGTQREFSLEYPCHSPEEKRWFNMLVTRFEYNGGIRIVVAHENITKRKLVEAELRSLSYVVEQSPVSIVLTDTKGSIRYVNPAAEKTTGYSRNELLGNNPRLFKSDYIKDYEYKVLWETITSGKYWKGEFHNIRKDGTMYWESATISPIFDENGVIEQFAAVKEDITERKEAEKKIQNLLTEKELILQEVHHRIKNNMNTIKGLLYLQAIEMKDTAAAGALHEAENRVQSMMILYDKLYSSHDYQEMSINSYLGPLIDEILVNFANHSIVKVEKDIANFTLDANVVFPLGIIVNELLTNIMKYAFIGRESGIITVSAKKNESTVTISLGDNGKGIPESINFDSSTGFGLNLVGMLTSQIGGNIKIERGDGTKFVLEFEV
jgi:PAS domain S-box-containing protein